MNPLAKKTEKTKASVKVAIDVPNNLEYFDAPGSGLMEDPERLAKLKSRLDSANKEN